ncbi:MAG: phosphatidylcholine/phosphatidylserine synthase [Kiritimatiellales bacterium]|jgi:CDP-diacylglycerol--serine O-phosphatidyltransferase
MTNEPIDETAEPRFNPVPSLITLCNAFCGFASIVYAITSYVRGEPIPQACIWLLLGAMIFDTLDGLAARMLHAKSLHGANLDSLADAISFGAAPAVAIFVFIRRNCPTGSTTAVLLVWAVALFYLACTLWRLARYNALAFTGKKDDGCFMGLPSPAGASMIYSAGLFIPRLDLGPHLFFYFLLGYAFLTSLLMVSDVPYPHARRCVSGEPRVLSFVFVCVVLGSILVFGVTAMVIWAYIYFLIAPLAELLVKKRAGRPARAFLFASFGKKNASRTGRE